MKLTLKLQDGRPILLREDGKQVGNVKNLTLQYTSFGLTVDVSFEKVPRPSKNSGWNQLPSQDYTFSVVDFDDVSLDIPLNETFFPLLADSYKRYAPVFGGPAIEKRMGNPAKMPMDDGRKQDFEDAIKRELGALPLAQNSFDSRSK